MRKVGGFKIAPGHQVPHHTVTHPAQHHRQKPTPKKPPPPSKAHKKPAPAKKPKKPVPKKPARKWSPGYDVACCSAQALGTLLAWDWSQVLEHYWRTAADPDAGATIADTLAAAGCPSCEWTYGVTPGATLILGVQLEEPHALAVTPDGRWWSWGEPYEPPPDLEIDEAWAVLL